MTRRRCSCRAPPTWTPATSRPTASATRARRWRSSRGSKDMHAAEGAPAAVQLLLHPPLHPCPARARLRLARRRSHARAKLFDAHMEEVRSGHDEEPPAPHAAAAGAATGLGRAHGRARRALPERRCCRSSRRTASRSPCAFRSRWTPSSRRIRLGGDVLGVPVQPGLACFTAHDHAPDFSWQRNFQVRGRPRGGGRRLGPRAAADGGRLRAAAGLEAAALPDERRQDGALLAHGKKNETRT